MDIKSIIMMIPGSVPLYNLVRSGFNQIRCAGSKYTCPICEKSFGVFIDKEHQRCPNCRSRTRQRLECLYLRQHTGIFDDEKCKILHFAPEYGFSKVLKKNSNLDYYSGDIRKGNAMYVIDITDVCFIDKEFDYVICNHVLEHIPDDKKAISEIYRVLKPGGSFVLTVPMSSSPTTMEQPLESDEERTRLYGQFDHVRLYGQDFPERLRNAGFDVDMYNTETLATPEEVMKYLLQENEIIFVARREKE